MCVCALLQGLPTDEAAAMMHQGDEVSLESIDEFGTPVLELFLTKDDNGEVQQQGTILSSPPDLQSSSGKCLVIAC